MSDKAILRTIFAVSGAVLLVVIILFALPPSHHIPDFAKVLPKLNATINATCTIVLLISFYFIKQKNITMHKRLNIVAFCLSAIFLLSYVVYHSFGVETRFPVDNPLRPLYLFILITHIVMAPVVLPIVLISFYRGLSKQFDKHKKIVKWSFPLWLYVTTTGVIVYLMISPYYPF